MSLRSTTLTLCSDCREAFQSLVDVCDDGDLVCALRDVIAVNEMLVNETDFTVKFMQVTFASSGHAEEFPVVLGDLDSSFTRGRVPVVVMGSACQDVVIGNAATCVTGETLPVPVGDKPSEGVASPSVSSCYSKSCISVAPVTISGVAGVRSGASLLVKDN